MLRPHVVSPSADGVPRDTAASTTVAPGRPSYHLLALLTLAHVVVDAYATTVPALLPFWQTRFALSYGLAGLITGIANVTSSVAQPLVGLLTDRGRDPRWIAVTCLLAAAGISATGLTHSYLLFLGFVVIGGLGVSGFHPQGYKLTGLYAGKNQAAATSWFLVGGNLGVALGPLVGTALALRFGPAGTAGLFPPGLLFAAALWWLVPRWLASATAPPGSRRRFSPYRGAGRASPPQAPATSLSGAVAAAATAPPHLVQLGRNRRWIAIMVLVAIVVLRSSVTNSLNSFIPLYYVRVAGEGEDVASRVLAGMLFLGAVATLAGGYLADRFGRLLMLGITLAVVPPLLLLFLAAPPSSPLAVGALWTAGAMVTASFSITVVLAQDLWYERRALASGVIVGFAFGVGGLLVPVIGVLADTWGLPVAFRMLAAIPLGALALTAVLAAIVRSDVERSRG